MGIPVRAGLRYIFAVVFGKYLVRRFHPQAGFPITIRLALIYCKLLSSILKTEHPQLVVKSFTVYSVLPLDFAVMPWCCDSYALMLYASCLKFFFKQGLDLSDRLPKAVS